MYRLTIYERDEKTTDEFDDEDDMREAVDIALNDLEKKSIKTFSVSWISEGGSYQKPFWEK